MTDTLWADVSEFQADVNDSYPYRFISIRSNDGTYQDHHFAYNLARAKHACDTGKLTGFIVYFVFESNWQETLATFKQMVGTPHPKMAVMIDVESWGGRYTVDLSAAINACREGVIGWLGGNRKRVIGYADAGDFARIWPSRGDCQVVLANYSSNPAFPGKLAHQFADNYNTPPFGPCDINSADGYSPDQLAAALGLTASAPQPAPAAPKPVAPAPSGRTYRVASGDTLSGIAAKFGTTWQRLAQINGLTNPNLLYIGQVLKIDANAVKPVAPKPAGTVYTVHQGDTLSGIATRFHTTWQRLSSINHLADPNRIFVGQHLRIG